MIKLFIRHLQVRVSAPTSPRRFAAKSPRLRAPEGSTLAAADREVAGSGTLTHNDGECRPSLHLNLYLNLYLNHFTISSFTSCSDSGVMNVVPLPMERIRSQIL